MECNEYQNKIDRILFYEPDFYALDFYFLSKTIKFKFKYSEKSE